MDIKEILVKTRDDLEAYGWVQERSFNLDAVLPSADITQAPACLSGAILRASQVYRLPLHQSLTERRAYHAALDALAQTINPDKTGDGHGIVVTWNDKKGRTMDEVIKLLDRVIATL